MKYVEGDKIIIINLGLRGEIISLDGSILSRKGEYYVKIYNQGFDSFTEHQIELDKQYYRNEKINKLLKNE